MGRGTNAGGEAAPLGAVGPGRRRRARWKTAISVLGLIAVVGAIGWVILTRLIFTETFDNVHIDDGPVLNSADMPLKDMVGMSVAELYAELGYPQKEEDRHYSFVVVPRGVESEGLPEADQMITATCGSTHHSPTPGYSEDTTIWLQVIDGRNLDPEAIADIRRDRPKLHRDLREMFPGCEATVISIGYEPGG